MTPKFALLALAISVCAQASEPILTTQTDDSTKSGWSLPSPAVARSVFGSFDADLKSLMRDYFAEHREIRDKRTILAARNSAICSTCPGKYAFIRASAERFSPLAGAHTFSYWTVDDRQKVLLYGSADRVDVVATGKAHASVDETHCTAAQCYKTRYDFDGKHYVPGECRAFDMDGRDLGGCKHD
jgi:hypothetical protein